MSRIRSIHPSLWTDEEFVSLSLSSRLFLIGLWNESDDYGLFEWKPLGLKMRLAPADNIDAAAVIGELKDAGFVVQFERDGKRYGAVKNFRKYQRPQKPSSPIIPLDDFIKSVIALPNDATSVKPVRDYSDSPTGIANPMEDVGCRMEERDNNLASLDCSPERDASSQQIQKQIPEKPKRQKPRTRIADDTQPEDADRAKAAAVGMNGETFRHEWGKFRDHHLKLGSQMADWAAAWRTWCAGWLDRGGKQAPPNSVAPGEIAEMTGFYAARESPQWVAWDGYKRSITGKGLPADPKGGWWVEAEWPPGWAPSRAFPEHRGAA